MIAAIVAVLIAPPFAPELLAFPYHAQSHGSDVWSETSLPQAKLDKVIGASAALVEQSPLAQRSEPRRIFLTTGGWRWFWLAVPQHGAFGVSRGPRETIVINRSDVGADRVWNGRSLGGVRSLSGIIAHETCHGLLRHRFGMMVDFSKPVWLREGYCDHVAGESSLTQAEVTELRAKGQNHPAIAYFEGRKRVELELQGNGGSIEALFANSGR
jgi:hypothetical protein